MKNTPNYLPWGIKESEFPKSGTIEEKIKFFINYGILAPSIHNTQPWRFKIVKKTLHILPDTKYKLPYADPKGRGIFVSLGACLANILTVADHFNIDAKYRIDNSSTSNTHITISFEEKSTSDTGYKNLFPYITKRISNKREYLAKPVNGEKLQKVLQFSNNLVNITLCADAEKIKTIANLYEKSATTFAKSPGFHKELSNWLRINSTTSFDGMPGFVSGFGELLSIVGKKFMSVSNIPVMLVAKKDKKYLSKSPVVGFLSSIHDDPSVWIEIGKIYEFIGLMTICLQLSITPMFAIIEDSTYSKEIKSLVNIDKDETLHFFFRLGYSNSMAHHTPRRDINDSLI